MQFYCRFGSAKLSPPEYIKAQIDYCGLKGIDLAFQFKINQVILSTQKPCLFDELQGEIPENTPVSAFIGTWQRRFTEGLADTQVVEPILVKMKTKNRVR